MNQYEAKQAARRDRLARAAAKAAAASDAAANAAHRVVEGIPSGQPILVGHHSEKRHRRDIDRMARHMSKSVQLAKDAEELARRAEAVGSAGISADDPDAVQKLEDKRSALEIERDHMKDANKYFKQHRTLDGWTGPDAMHHKAQAYIRHNGVPFPPYALTNIGARIRSAAKRVTVIEATAALPSTTEHIGDVTITTDADDNRVTVTFPRRLTRDEYKDMRTHGFLWSPTRNGFTRRLSNAAVHYARQLATRFTAAQ